jgi:hypothetical protein
MADDAPWLRWPQLGPLPEGETSPGWERLNHRVVSALAAAPVVRQGGILELIDIVLRKAEARVTIVGDDKLTPASSAPGQRCPMAGAAFRTCNLDVLPAAG